MLELWGKAEYPFIAIIPRSTQDQIGSTWEGSIYRSNRTKLCAYAKRIEWCIGYRRRKLTRQHEIKSWTSLTAFLIELILLGKVWI